MRRMISIALPLLAFLALAASAQAGAKYPEEIAAAVALYPDAQVMAMQKDADGVQAVLTSTDAPDRIIAHYKSALAENGWNVEQEVAAGGMEGLVVVNDGKQLTISVMAGSGGGQANLITLALETK